MITKTAIGNYLRKQPNGDVGMYRNGFKDGVQWAQRRLAAPVQQPAEAQDYKKLYEELLYCVGSKYQGETRHETAKRYLIDREKFSIGADKAQEPKP